MVKSLARRSILVLILTALLCAADFTALKPEGYVSDFARVLDAGSRQQIEQYCQRVKTATGVEMAIVTLPSLGGQPPEDVANALFRKWGIGQKGADSGILLLLSIGDRRSRLEVGYGLEPIITDGDAGTVLRAMRPYLREGRYGDALMEAAGAIGSQIAQAKHVSLGQPAPRPQNERHESHLPTGLILFAGVILFGWLVGMLGSGRRRGGPGGGGGIGSWLPWLILGNMTGRGWSSDRGGGGFGGYDSGGGFGGFGGGDSGGGGASSNW